jgi:endonuclease I
MSLVRLYLVFTSIFFTTIASAQGFQVVFPGLNGATLLDSMASYYRPVTVLPYALARDTLYANILAIDDDSIRCIYSGHTLYLDPTQDPTQYIYLNGSANGMNTEHAYPQSKGAANGNARSDMHHIYPARIPVNEARADKPYTNIPDNQTDKWFINNQVSTSIPTADIAAYSESDETRFEPRESVKGDLARSVFYFYTMYKAQAFLADSNYFNLQRLTLCQWNALDPADSAELKKTWRIAPYQEGKANPFVLDCTLANRCYCPEVPPNCSVSIPILPATVKTFPMRVAPNPVRLSQTTVSMELPESGILHLEVLDMQGRVLGSFMDKIERSGSYEIKMGDICSLSAHGSGVLQATLTITTSGFRYSTSTGLVW